MSIEPAAGPRELLRGHVPALDGVRGIAILLVLLVHLTPWKEPYHGWREALLSLADCGWIGVDLFFVLSAFLITGILIESRDAPHYFRNFYVRRALRIFPLYYATIAVECLLLPRIFGVHSETTAAALNRQWALWTYTANWVPNIFRGEWLSLGHMWSLSMEEQFYLLWAILIAAVPLRLLPRVTLAIGSLLFAVQIATIWSDSPATIGPFVFSADTLSHFDSFIAGSWIAAAIRLPSHLPHLRRWLRPIAIISTLAIAETIRRNVLNGAIYTTRTPAALWAKTLVFPALALCFASLVALAVMPEGRLWQKVLAIAPLRFFGRYSYGIYVVHGVLLPLFPLLLSRSAALALAGNGNRASLLYFGMATVISVAGALVTYYALERPFLLLKRRFGG